MSRHKHDCIKCIHVGGDSSIDICSCGKRRYVVVSGTWSKAHATRWLTEEESLNYMLDWIFKRYPLEEKKNENSKEKL